jgi:enamine deaminase RidA (YjgF/YER057c/UK114 family)
MIPLPPRRAFTFALLCGLVALTSAGAAEPARRAIDPRSNVGDPRPFSGAVLVGNTLYLSGHIGLLGTGDKRKVPDTADAEARLVLDGIKATLEAAGMTMDDLVSVQIHCSDLSHYGAFNAIYRTYFTREFPARAFLGTNKLLFDARFEVLGIAVKR